MDKDTILNWYVVYWRNKEFIRTRFRPEKAGTIFGMKERSNQRMGLNRKKGNFEVVEKHKFLMKGTAIELKKWLEQKDI